MKKWNLKVGSLFLMVVMVFLSACGSNTIKTNDDDNEKRRINVVTTIAQIGEPISIIGGERVEVKSLMGPSVDPHLYNATQSDIQTVADADLIFYNGLNLEANMVEVFNEISKEKSVLAIGETISNDQLLKDEEGAIDPHIWFDLHLWQEAINAAVDELIDYSPEDKDYFEKNKESYFKEIASLKVEANKLSDISEEQRILVTAHDAFGYFGRMHNMKVVGLQGLSTDSEIGLSDIQKTIDIIEEYNVPAIFVESSVNDSSIKAVIEGAKSKGINVTLGGELFSDAMGEAGTEEGTYIGMYRHNVNTIYESLKVGDE